MTIDRILLNVLCFCNHFTLDFLEDTHLSDYDRNQELAAGYLQRFRDHVTGHFIDGESVLPADAATFANLSPIDNRSLGDARCLPLRPRAGGKDYDENGCPYSHGNP